MNEPETQTGYNFRDLIVWCIKPTVKAPEMSHGLVYAFFA